MSGETMTRLDSRTVVVRGAKPKTYVRVPGQGICSVHMKWNKHRGYREIVRPLQHGTLRTKLEFFFQQTEGKYGQSRSHRI